MSNSEYLNCSASLYLFQLLSRSINFRISECSTWFSQVQWGLLCFYFDKSYIFVCFSPDNYEKSNFSNLCWCCCVLAEQYGKLSFFQVDVIDVKYFVKTWKGKCVVMNCYMQTSNLRLISRKILSRIWCTWRKLHFFVLKWLPEFINAKSCL